MSFSRENLLPIKSDGEKQTLNPAKSHYAAVDLREKLQGYIDQLLWLVKYPINYKGYKYIKVFYGYFTFYFSF